MVDLDLIGLNGGLGFTACLFWVEFLLCWVCWLCLICLVVGCVYIRFEFEFDLRVLVLVVFM